MKENARNWSVVVNPYAGSGKTLEKWEVAEELLSRKGVSYTKAMPGPGSNVTSLSREAAARGERNFISVGGDGTAHDILSGIMQYITTTGGKVSISDFTLAVIPIGSGNDWIRSHHIPRDLDKVTDLIAAGSFSVQDVVRVQVWNCHDMTVKPSRESYMLNVGGGAFDARICSRVNYQKRKGKQSRILYFAALLHILCKTGYFDVTVEAGGRKVYDGSIYNVAFGLGRYSGGGMRQTPDAILDDGLLDMTLIPASLIPRKVFHMYRLFTSRFTRVTGLVCARASEYVIRPKDGVSPVKVEVDGEIIGTMPVRLTVLDGQLNVLHCYE